MTFPNQVPISIQSAQNHPYDGDGHGLAEFPDDWARLAARAIMADLGDRRGIKHGLQMVPGDARHDIISTAAAIIRACVPASNPE